MDRPGTETATLLSTEGGWRLSGLAEFSHPEGPLSVRYRLDCDPEWRTRRTQLDLRLSAVRQKMLLVAQGDGHWKVDGMERQDLHGCIDVDLAVSPATNTIPLRRLQLPVGAGAETTTVWVTFPDLDLHPVRQRYTRLTENRYGYEAPHNKFVAEFDVDDFGFVLHYPNYWVRE